jgi:hypothetical protein
LVGNKIGSLSFVAYKYQMIHFTAYSCSALH